ncbi:MAG: MmcQ/YjbR family DNA-binding protein [Planctomycetota bacterium]
MRSTDAVRLALGFPAAHEEPHFQTRSFRVGKRIFATMPPDAEHLHVFVEAHVARAAARSEPVAISELHWGKQLAGVRVLLAAISRETLRALLESAWRRRATKALIAAFERERG